MYGSVIRVYGISVSYWIKLETTIAFAFMTCNVDFIAYELHLDVDEYIEYQFYFMYTYCYLYFHH